MQTMDLAVEYDSNKNKYRIFDNSNPTHTLAIAETKESAYKQMIALAVRESAKDK
jgi:hypothetical protein